MTSWSRIVARAAVGVALASGSARSAAAEPPVGVGQGALPAVHRVGLPLELRHLTVGASAGYGYTEPLTDDDGAHHRAGGTVALAAPLLGWLQLAARLDGRFDHHEEGPGGSDSSAVGEPRIGARAVHALGRRTHLGAEVVVWLPGADAPSVEPAATTPELRALLALTPSDRLRVGATVGYRLDRSARSVQQPERLSLGDRASLGVSDSDAVLAGLGATLGLGRGEALAEVTFEPLVGSDAPGILESPLRVAAGYRHFVLDALQVGGVVEVLAGARPDVAPTAPLAPIEPRVQAHLTFAYRFGGAEAPAEHEPKQPPDRTEPKAEPQAPAAPPSIEEPAPPAARVVVTAPDGTVVKDAVVLLERDGGKETLVFRDGAYVLDASQEGEALLVVVADGYEDVERPVTLEPGQPFQAEVRLEPALPHGQIRGLVRSFSGEPIEAHIRVEPVGTTEEDPRDLSADQSGRFSIDVAPGRYLVEIGADGYQVQKRQVDVKKRGVVILNADLHEAR